MNFVIVDEKVGHCAGFFYSNNKMLILCIKKDNARNRT